MGIMCKRITGGFAWLAVFLTPVTGAPHFVCRCPDGHFKPFCLGSASKASGCCCGCACCRRSSEGKGGCCSTCGTSTAGRSPAELSPGSRCFSGETGCVKTLAGQELLAPGHGKRAVCDDLPSEAGLSMSAVLLTPLANGARQHLFRRGHFPVPPADLVTLLGRLLI